MAMLRALSKLTCRSSINCHLSQRFNSSVVPALTMLSEEETAFQDSVRRICRQKIQPYVLEMDWEHKMRRDIIDILFQNGFMGVDVDPKYGGTGSTFFTSMLVVEELARIDPSVSVLCDVQNTIVSQILIQYANEEQKAKYLPKLCKSSVGSFCLSEAESGSDAFSLQTEARKTSQGYEISGTKLWITNAEHADFFIVFATVDRSLGYKGITAFLLDADMHGVEVHPPEYKLGLRASSTCIVNLDEVEVPETAVIGEIGQGYKYAIQALNEGRIGIGAQMVGLAQGAFDIAFDYVQQRKQFGKPVVQFQALQHQIATVATQIEAARLLVYNSARLREAGKPFVKEAAMAKWYSSEVAAFASSKAVEWMGGIGFTNAGRVEKFYRDSKIGAIYEGTSNIQLDTIAKQLLKESKA